MANTVVKIDRAKAYAIAAEALKRNMERAMMFVEGVVIRSINRGQPVERVGKRLVGLDPSREGEPPKVLYGRLKQAQTHEVLETEDAVIGRMGSNVEYQRRLELGFVGTDKAGRNISEGPRPHLVPALQNNKIKIAEILRRRSK